MPKGQKLNFSDADIQEMIELYGSGLSQYSIAAMFKISRTAVANILRGKGVKGRHRNTISEGERQYVIDEYLKNHNQSAIEKQMHMDIHVIRRILHEAGIKTNDTLCHRLYDIDDTYFDEISTPNKAYVLGLLCADGNVSRNKGQWKICLQEKDKQILEDICKDMKTDRPLLLQKVQNTYHKQTWQNQYLLEVGNQHMHDKLIEYGITPNKSLTLQYPTVIKDELLPHFIRGYYDGDGTSYRGENGTICSLMGTFDFCNVLKTKIKDSILVNASIYPYRDSKKTCTLQISGGLQTFKFFTWIYQNADLKLERKYAKFCADYSDKLMISPM